MAAPSPILLPIIALVAWTFVIWGWMYATRIPAIRAAKMRLDPAAPRGQQMSELPPRVRWKADNYNHLLEQPTLFYAVALVLALANAGDGPNLTLAWCYVGSRVVHSFVQTLVNTIEIRFAVFFLSSLVLGALTIRAGLTLV